MQHKIEHYQMELRFFRNGVRHKILNTVEGQRRVNIVYRWFPRVQHMIEIYRDDVRIGDQALMTNDLFAFLDKVYLSLSETEFGSAGTQPEEG